MKQRILKSWLLFSALYSIVSTVFIFLFRKWFNFDHLEEISFQETLGTITLFLLILLFLSLISALILYVLNRQAERKITEQLLMIQKAQFQLVKDKDESNWLNEATILDLNAFYTQSMAISNQIETVSLELQEIGRKPQYVGEETKEQIIEIMESRGYKIKDTEKIYVNLDREQFFIPVEHCKKVFMGFLKNDTSNEENNAVMELEKVELKE